MDYTDTVLDHFLNPRNMGDLPDANGVGKVGNSKCGAIMEIYFNIHNNVIEDVKFKTFGCAAAIASSSISTTMIIGKTISEALKVTNKDVLNALGGLPPVKIHCSLLAEEAIKSAISNYYERIGIDPIPIVGKIKDNIWLLYKFIL